MMRLKFLTLAAAVLLATIPMAVPSQAAGSSLPPLGVLAAGQDKIDSYEEWLGRSVSHTTVFVGGGSWANMKQSAGWAANRWSGSRIKAVYSIEMFPPGANFAAGNNGSYDSHWRDIAARIASADPDGIIRLGWEANGPWFDWAWGDNPGAYRDYFRRVVDIFRSQPGQRFEFMWDLAKRVPEVDLAAYPGDGYVDIVGLSFYDRSSWVKEADPVERWRRMSSTYGTSLRWLDEFTQAHGKKMAFAEWALNTQHYAGVNPDNTLFIQNFHDWLSARSGRVAFANYFESAQNSQGYFGLSNPDTPFPNSAVLFRQLFGGSNSVPPTTAAPRPTTTTAAPRPTTTAAPRPTTTTAAPRPTTTAAPRPTTTAAPRPTTTTAAPRPTTTAAPRPSVPTTVAPRQNTDPPPSQPDPRLCPPSEQHLTASSDSGYWILRRDGSVQSIGVPFFGDLSGSGVTAVAIEPTPANDGYWILTSDGGIFAFGGAVGAGDLRNYQLEGAPQGIASPNAGGYWVVGADGGVFAFGLDFYGSMGDVELAAPVINIASKRDGSGYWLVGADGGVFAFGAAAFAGSTGGWDLDGEIVSMAVPPAESGYWLYGEDGGVFAFGAPFHGSIPQHPGCGDPEAVHLEPTASGEGYWVVDRNGVVYAFGDAPHLGNASSQDSPVVGFAAG